MVTHQAPDTHRAKEIKGKTQEDEDDKSRLEESAA